MYADLQVVTGDIRQILLSVHFPVLGDSADLPDGAIGAVQSSFGTHVTVVPEPEAGFQITLRIHPPPQGQQLSRPWQGIHTELHSCLVDRLRKDEHEVLAGKLAAVRSVLMGAPLRKLLKSLNDPRQGETVCSVIAIPHRPMECFYAIPQVWSS